jgi:hypothetical protein
MNTRLINAIVLVISTFFAATLAAQTPEDMQKSEAQMLAIMRRAFTYDELEAFIRTHPNSEQISVILTRLGRSQQRDVIATQQALDQIAATPPSADLLKRAGLISEAQLKTELQYYLQVRLALLENTKQRHRAATGKDIDMGDALTVSPIAGEISNAVLTAPLWPLPYRVGYSWTMRSEDVLTQKVTEYTRKVTQLLPNGYIEINNGAVVLDLNGNVRTLNTPKQKRSFNLNYRQHPQSLLRGREHTFGYTITDSLSDGRVFVQQGTQGRMTSVGPDISTFPFGEHITWRVERSSQWAVAETGVSGTYTLTAWYSPELRRYVKSEEISRNAEGKVIRHERHELLKTD